MILGGHFMDLQEKKLDKSRKVNKSGNVIGLVSVIGCSFYSCCERQRTANDLQRSLTDVLDKGKFMRSSMRV